MPYRSGFFGAATGCGISPKHVVVALLKGDGEREDLRLGIASDEVIGTFSASEDALLDQAPADVPHCRGCCGTKTVWRWWSICDGWWMCFPYR